MWPFFALPCVLAEEVDLQDIYGVGTAIFPCIKTLPMGFSHAVFLAQAAHEHILDTRTSFPVRIAFPVKPIPG